MTVALRLDNYPGSDVLVLRPVGELCPDTYAELRDGLLKCAAQEPPAMVVDLDSLRVTARTSLAVFPAVWMRINDWPGVPMALVAARPPLRALLESSAVVRFVPTYPTVAEALEALQAEPPRRRREVTLPWEVSCGRLVRRAVAEICAEWGVPQIVPDAVLVASELTENLIQHTRSAGWLRLELRGPVLTVAVVDADPHPPQLRPPHERRDGGRGLVLVAELSRAWGYAPRARGKVVWAALAVPGR
jgi:anti-anti-sigma regulatory factor